MQTPETPTSEPELNRPRARPSAWFVGSATFAVAYTLLFLVRPQDYWPTWATTASWRVSRAVYDFIDAAFGSLGLEQVDKLWRHAGYLGLVAGIVPLAAALIVCRGRVSGFGLRMPNRIGWRILAIGYVCSLPFLLWMIASPTFAAPYIRDLHRAGAPTFLGYYAINMLTEHFFLHGVILGLLRHNGRWPNPPNVERDRTASRLKRALQWVGLAQKVKPGKPLANLRQWVGLPERCVGPLIVSAILFAAVHLGKNPRELVLSLPGGIAMAYIAYRTNTWITSFLLHLATAGTVCLWIVIRSS